MAEKTLPDDYGQLISKGLAGPNILINGEAGTGKTFTIGTLIDWCQTNGYEAFYFDIDNSLETLLGYWRDVGVPPFNRKEPAPIPTCLRWHQMQIAPVSLAQMLKGAENTGNMTYELLTKMQDNNRGGDNNPFWRVLSALSNFKDDRTGQSFGPVEKFDVKKVLIVESFTTLSNAAAKMVVGARPTMAPPDYGTAQNHLMNFLRLCCHGIPMTFVMTAHPARDKDEVTGSVNVTIKTVGTAIQPEIPPLFSDMIYAVRKADKFSWSTAEYGVVCKTRSLGYRQDIKPDFGQIMNLWKARRG